MTAMMMCESSRSLLFLCHTWNTVKLHETRERSRILSKTVLFSSVLS